MFVLPLIYFLEGQYWQIFVVQVVCCCFFYGQQHALKTWQKNNYQKEKQKWFFILAAQWNAWHSYHKFQRYLNNKQRCSFMRRDCRSAFWKKKNTTKGNMTTTCVCLSNIHKFIYVTAPKRTILQKKKKGWLHNLSTAQCDMTWRKIIFTNLTQNRFGYNCHKIFNYYTKWFGVTAF